MTVNLDEPGSCLEIDVQQVLHLADVFERIFNLEVMPSLSGEQVLVATNMTLAVRQLADHYGIGQQARGMLRAARRDRERHRDVLVRCADALARQASGGKVDPSEISITRAHTSSLEDFLKNALGIEGDKPNGSGESAEQPKPQPSAASPA